VDAGDERGDREWMHLRPDAVVVFPHTRRPKPDDDFVPSIAVEVRHDQAWLL